MTGADRRALPEPGRRDRVRARPRAPGTALCAPTRSSTGWSRRRGADRQPARRPAAVRDRADRPVLQARRPDQGELGGDLRRRARSSRGRGVLRRPATAQGADRRRRERCRRADRSPGPRRGRARCSRCSTSSPSPARRSRRRCASSCTCPTRGPRGPRDRARRRRSRSIRRGAPTTPRRASGSSSCSARPSAGARRRTASTGRASTRWSPSFTRRDVVRARGAVHLRPRGRREQVLLLAARRRRPARVQLHRDGALPRRARAAAGRAGAVELHGALADAGRGVEARRSTDALPGRRLGAADDRDARRAAAPQGRARADHSFDALVAELLEERRDERSTSWSTTLLWEGYALYPYTPGATKNATPTPFGIVYPPAYAAGSPTTFDRIRMQVRRRGRRRRDAGERGALPAARRRAPRGRRAARRAAGAARALDGERRRDAVRVRRPSAGALRMARAALDERLARVGAAACTTRRRVADGPGPRARRCALSLLSTHVVAARRRRALPVAVAPPEHGAAAVMACAASTPSRCWRRRRTTSLLGAAIVLPDHPQLAPESRGDLFDATEIEEALLLHVLALSDGEREADRASRTRPCAAMLERAVSATPEDILRLHGARRRCSDPAPRAEPTRRRRRCAARSEATVDGVTYRRGDQRASCAPAAGSNAQDHLLDGRSATIERIYIDYDGRGPPRRDGRRRPRPGADARDRPLPVLQARRGGGDWRDEPACEKQILVAGVGNAWLRDDAFGGEVARAARGARAAARA